MDTPSSSSEHELDSGSSDDGTNIDNPGEKYTGTPKKVATVEQNPEEVHETEELSSSGSDDTLVVSSSESDIYHDATTEGNESIGEAEHDPDNTLQSSENLDKGTDESPDAGQEVVSPEAKSHVHNFKDDRPIDEPAVETKGYSIEEAAPPLAHDLTEATANEDESSDLDQSNIPADVKGYVNDIIQGACNELRSSSEVDNNNDNEPDRHLSLNDTDLNEYDIVSPDEPTAMGEGVSKVERDLSKDPSIPADVSNLTEGESTGPAGDPVVIIDYKKRKFSNDDEDSVPDEHERLLDSFVKKLKRDNSAEEQQVPEYESIPKDSLASSPTLETDDLDGEDPRDDSNSEYENRDETEAAVIDDVEKDEANQQSFSPLTVHEVQGKETTEFTEMAPGCDDNGELQQEICTPSDDDGEDVEGFVEIVERELLPESEAQRPSEVTVDSENNPSETASEGDEELPVGKVAVDTDYSPCFGGDEVQSGKQEENPLTESGDDVASDDGHQDDVIGGFTSFDDRTPPEDDDSVPDEHERLLDSFVKKRDNSAHEQQVPENESIPKDSLAGSLTLETDDLDGEDHRDDSNSINYEYENRDETEAAVIDDVEKDEANQQSFSPLTVHEVQGKETTEFTEMAPGCDDNGELEQEICTPSDDDGEDVDGFVEILEKENLPESEAQRPSEVTVGSESNPSETVSAGDEELSVGKVAVETDFSPCIGGDEVQSGKQEENLLTGDDVASDDGHHDDPPKDNSKETSEPSIVIDYESKETVSEEKSTETNEWEKLVDNFVDDHKLDGVDVTDESTDSDISSEELDEKSQPTDNQTNVDDVAAIHNNGEIESEKLAKDTEEKLLNESVPNDYSLNENEKSSSQLVNFLKEYLEMEDANEEPKSSSTGVISDQPVIIPVQDLFDVEKQLAPEISTIGNLINGMHDNQTINGKPESMSDDDEPQSDNFPKRIYTEEEVRRAIQILTSRPPYDDIDPESFYEKMYDPTKFDRVFALALASKPKEKKTRMFGLFSNPNVPSTDNRFTKDLNEDDDNIPFRHDGNDGIDLTELMQSYDQPITAETGIEVESRPAIPVQYILDDGDEIGDVGEDNDDDRSLSSSSASSGIYVLEENSAIKEELDEELQEFNKYSSSENESSDYKLPARNGQVFCVTTIPDNSEQIVPETDEIENVSINFSFATPDDVESSSPIRKGSLLSSDNDFGNSENAPFEKEVFVETETRIIHLSDDRAEYDKCQTPNADTPEQVDTAHKEDSQDEERLMFNEKQGHSDSPLPDDTAALTNSTEKGQDDGVDFRVFLEHSPREEVGDTNDKQYITDEFVVPTNIQRSAFNPQTIEGIEWETPLKGESDEEKHDFSFKVTTPTYITFEENVLPPDYEDRFVDEAEVVPNVLNPDENCPFNFEFNHEDKSRLVHEPEMAVIHLGNDEKTPDDTEERRNLLDSIADILDVNADQEQSDAESIDSNPPHFFDKQEVQLEDPHSTQELISSQPLDLSAYLYDNTGAINICPGGSSFVVVGTPCKTDENVELPTFVGLSESCPYNDSTLNERDATDTADDVGEQHSSSSESLSSIDNSDDDSDDNNNEEVPYEQFQNDIDFANDENQPTYGSDIPLSMSLPLDQLSDPSSSSDNEDDFTHSFPVELDDEVQGHSSGRKSSSSSSSCSSNNTAQEPGVAYEYLDEEDGDDASLENSLENTDNTFIHEQKSPEVPCSENEDTLADSTSEDPESSNFQVLLENEKPSPHENPNEDSLTTSYSDSMQPIVMIVYLDKEPLNDIGSDNCKLEEPVESHTTKETESVPLVPDEHVTFNMYLDKPPLEESPVEYDEYLELEPREGSEDKSEPDNISNVEGDVVPEESDEVNCMAPKDDLIYVENFYKDAIDPEQADLLTSDSDDITPPRHRGESSSAASAFSDSDDQEELSSTGPSVVFALIGRPSLDNPEDNNADVGINPDLRDADGSSELPIVFQGSVEVFRETSSDDAQKRSVTYFQEVCHSNQDDDEPQLPDAETNQHNTVYYMERETHIVHQSITTIEVSRSMSQS